MIARQADRPALGKPSPRFCVWDDCCRKRFELTTGASPENLPPLEQFTPPDKGEALAPNLAVELQYGKTFGAPHFLQWLKEYVRRVHAPPYPEWEVLTTAGNTDGVDGLLRVLFNSGDSLLVEEFGEPFHAAPLTTAYPGAM